MYGRLRLQIFAPYKLNSFHHALSLQVLKPKGKSSVLPRPPGLHFLVARRMDIYEVGVVGGASLFAIMYRALEIVREIGEGYEVGYVIVFFPCGYDTAEDEDDEAFAAGRPSYRRRLWMPRPAKCLRASRNICLDTALPDTF